MQQREIPNCCLCCMSACSSCSRAVRGIFIILQLWKSFPPPRTLSFVSIMFEPPCLPYILSTLMRKEQLSWNGKLCSKWKSCGGSCGDLKEAENVMPEYLRLFWNGAIMCSSFWRVLSFFNAMRAIFTQFEMEFIWNDDEICEGSIWNPLMRLKIRLKDVYNFDSYIAHFFMENNGNNQNSAEFFLWHSHVVVVV